MEDVQSEQSGTTITEKFRTLDHKLNILENKEENKKAKEINWPWKWKWKLKQSRRKDENTVPVIFMDKKNVINPPRYMPIFDGNIIVYKNKPYIYDPRGLWRIKMKGFPTAYVIREIDRRPLINEETGRAMVWKRTGQVVYDASVSNQDIDQVRESGNSTENDEFLIKAALKAQTSSLKGKMNIGIMVVLGIILVGGLIYLLTSGAIK